MNSTKTIYLKDYTPPNYLITHTDLEFKLDADSTIVKAQLSIKPNKITDNNNILILNGENLKLKSIQINNKDLNSNSYTITDTELHINAPMEKFTLTTIVEISPLKNTALEGLYKSGDILCTQCEANGFRRITYYMDRPDVMSCFTTTIYADKTLYPILLSNGNPIERGQDDTKHWVCWQDPNPKPCYLFALVAGNLDVIKDIFITKSNRPINLEIYCDPGNKNKCQHAMTSLKKSMQWDEKRFGREYDLDIYMIVAVDSFNMGAMENKGLNIFNSCYVLADQESATDNNFLGIEAVIAHEYFHNWTGNRITCRDWFQLTLKEGLTVFRDQCFSADMNSEILQRIDDVSTLRNRQFPEDAGPTAHPIKPKSYIKMDNFYTATVYEKGAEVIRMYYTILGKDKFYQAMDYYFNKFDGQAITTEDFFEAMQSATDIDLTQFLRWYDLAGTPLLEISDCYNAKENSLHINIKQSIPKLKYQDFKPLLIPLSIGLLDANGNDIKIQCPKQPLIDKGLLLICEEEQTFIFNNITAKPILSLNRNFSAPVNISYNYSNAEYVFLAKHDNDDFNRFEAIQSLSKNILLKACQNNAQIQDYQAYTELIGEVLKQALIKPAFTAKMLQLPSVDILLAQQKILNFKDTFQARKNLTTAVFNIHGHDIAKIYMKLNPANDLSPKSIKERELKNTLLYILASDNSYFDLVKKQFDNALNMTETIGALQALIKLNRADEALKSFYKKWNKDNLVIQKWLALQASSHTIGDIPKIQTLLQDDIYDKTIPNFVRSVIGAFSNNHLQFNKEDGSGYVFFTAQLIQIDAINPQIAARLAGAYRNFNKLPKNLKLLMLKSLNTIVADKNISDNTREIIEMTLKND